MITSPSGANTFLVRGFKSKQSLNNHWRDHGKQYQGFTSAQYEQRAQFNHPDYRGGANRMSLNEARKAYRERKNVSA